MYICIIIIVTIIRISIIVGIIRIIIIIITIIILNISTSLCLFVRQGYITTQARVCAELHTQPDSL